MSSVLYLIKWKRKYAKNDVFSDFFKTGAVILRWERIHVRPKVKGLSAESCTAAVHRS